jgi:hypothetical protein
MQQKQEPIHTNVIDVFTIGAVMFATLVTVIALAHLIMR